MVIASRFGRPGRIGNFEEERAMVRYLVRISFALAALAPAVLHAQHAMPANPAPVKSAPAKMTTAQKIANAMSAAPTEISRNATILDWPETAGGQPKQLRAGTNGWVCFPNTPMEFAGASGDDPMCVDKQWQAWADAWEKKAPPKITGTGIAYMLKGDKGASNTDPFATGPTATNDWVVAPPHIMVLYEDLKMLDAFPTDPKSGGPWVMWKGTPYAHLMVPVSPTKAAKMGSGK
jgi:hypothetical protein